MSLILQEEGRKKALDIIKNAKYMALATSDLKSKPWIAPLRFGCDKEYNFYFISTEGRLHVRHIYENPNVAIAIVDPEQDMSVQIDGIASKVDVGDLGEAGRIYYEWRFSDTFERARHYRPPKYFDTDSDQRFFKVQVVNAYIKFKDEISRDRIAINLF